ncbi:hypothetical protein IC582_017030 [Cucumis melo]
MIGPISSQQNQHHPPAGNHLLPPLPKKLPKISPELVHISLHYRFRTSLRYINRPSVYRFPKFISNPLRNLQNRTNFKP